MELGIWNTLILSRTGDKATLASDLSTDPEAGTGGRRSLPPDGNPGSKALNAISGIERVEDNAGPDSLLEPPQSLFVRPVALGDEIIVH